LSFLADQIKPDSSRKSPIIQMLIMMFRIGASYLIVYGVV